MNIPASRCRVSKSKNSGHCEDEPKPRVKRGGKRRGSLTVRRLRRYARNDRKEWCLNGTLQQAAGNYQVQKKLP